MDTVAIKLPDWEMNVFKVSGINPSTNRRKSEMVVIVGDDLEKAKQKSGLKNISSVDLVEPEPPSTAQIKCGNNLGIEFRSYYTKRDYSALISIALGEDVYIPIDNEAAEFAAEHNIYLSQYSSLCRLYRNYYYELSLFDAAVFFAFSVYQSLNGFVCYDFQHHPKYDLFMSFANENINNSDFTSSLLKYKNPDELAPNYERMRKSTKAYKICSEYLKNK